MKLVVGLGNPGRRYEGTRHNIGYAILAELARKFGAGPPKARFHGAVVEADLSGQKALLLSPTTFMNLSGTSVQEAKSFYKLADEDLLVVCDDLNLPVGKLRFRARGSSGGQKGLEDIIRRLGTEDFPRLRIGVGTAPEGWDWADYVLGKFTPEELARDGTRRGVGRRRRGGLGPRGHRVLHESIQLTCSHWRSRTLAANVYEGMFILDPNRYGRDAETVSGQIPAMIEKLGGEMLVSRLWEERRLAFPIKGQRRGTYWLTYFRLDSSRLGDLRRQCQITEDILRVLFLKVDPRIVDALVAHALSAPVVGPRRRRSQGRMTTRSRRPSPWSMPWKARSKSRKTYKEPSSWPASTA